MSQAASDRNLLFGILALQMDFITRDALIEAMNAWAVDKTKPLGQILEERGALPMSRRSMLEPLVDEHVRAHGGDPARSLAAISTVGSAFEPLQQVADTDVQASLAHVVATRSPDDPRATMAPAVEDGSAPRVRYRRLRPHARGGLGEVFVAHDSELHREVALKEIQDEHADNQTSRARFTVEAEITGGLEHPGIVPVYGLGSYSDGRPFYAMRFIKGDSLAHAIKGYHADPSLRRDPGERTLALQKLLRRFLDVCNAIAYAHSRGVLHRDLKPGNIMVGTYGETLVVDWGLAKLLDRPEVADAETFLSPPSGSGVVATVAGTALGTPAYMPPEQATGRLDDHGPRSDVYSLGATLYHLLTDHPPFTPAADLGATLARIQKGEFPRPRELAPDVPRPLEAICLKAMALRPDDRYATPLALAADIEDWLADKPVSALPESASQRLARWARRHRAWVRAGAAALAIVSIAAVAAAVLVNKARRNESIQKDLAEERRQEAEKRLAQIVKANEILGSIFEELDPGNAEKEGKPLSALLGERLDRATAELEGEAIGDPLAVARMQQNLGSSQSGLGFPEKAIRLFIKARGTFATQLGPDHPDTLSSMNRLAMAYHAAGKLEQSLPLLEETLALRKSKLGPDHPDTLASMNNVAVGYQAAGKFDRSLPVAEETLSLRRSKLGPDHRDTLASMDSLAVVYRATGRLDRALPLFEEALELRKSKLGTGHPETLNSMNNLSAGYWAAGRLDRALPLVEESLSLRRSKLGPDHPDTLNSMNNLAECYRDAGKLDRALPLYEETLALRRSKLGPDHPRTFTSMNNLAEGYRDAGKLDRAMSLHEEVLSLRKSKLGSDHPDTLASMNSLAADYRAAGQLDRTLPLLEEVLALRRSKLGPDHPSTLISMSNLAVVYRAVGRLDRALPLLRELTNLWKLKAGADSAQYAVALSGLGSGLLQQKTWTEAEPILRDCLAILEAKEPDTWRTFDTKSMLGGALLGQKNYVDAGPLLQSGYEGLKARSGKIPPQGKVRLVEALDRLVNLAEATGKPDEAAKWKDEKAKLAPAPVPSPEKK
jgi:serine/threonine protein kinase